MVFRPLKLFVLRITDVFFLSFFDIADRPSLNEGWKVEKIQDIYVEALRTYIENRRQPRPTTIFAKLLSVLTELRTLGNLNSELCFSLKIKNKKLPPFLAEIWDVAV